MTAIKESIPVKTQTRNSKTGSDSHKQWGWDLGFRTAFEDKVLACKVYVVCRVLARFRVQDVLDVAWGSYSTRLGLRVTISLSAFCESPGGAGPQADKHRVETRPPKELIITLSIGVIGTQVRSVLQLLQ